MKARMQTDTAGAAHTETARSIFVSASADPRLTDCLKGRGFDVCRVHTSDCVSAPVSDHPDMFMCKLGADEGPVIMWGRLAETLAPCTGAPDRLILSWHDPLMRYPKDIAYNAACTGRFLIHNLKHTAPDILSEAEKMGVEFVDVAQGYAKCSIVIVDETSIITYDEGIARACSRCPGLDVLLVSPGHVLLEGYDTGFIGGTSGRIGDEVIFSGDLSAHPDFHDIISFIEDRGLGCRWFSGFPLTDIGSII